MHTLKIRTIGQGMGAVFPKKMLAELGVAEGDTVYATPAPDGSIRLTAEDPAFARPMKVAEEIMREDAAILRLLAATGAPA